MAMRADDTAGVIAPPPFLFLGTLAVGVGLDLLLLHTTTGLGPVRWGVAAALATLALALFAGASQKFARAKTPIPPWEPTTAIVTTGVYAHTRNPIYVAMAALYLAVALAADSVWALVLLPPLLAVIQYGVVAREERYLSRVFGEDYEAYRGKVRRWV